MPPVPAEALREVAPVALLAAVPVLELRVEVPVLELRAEVLVLALRAEVPVLELRVALLELVALRDTLLEVEELRVGVEVSRFLVDSVPDGVTVRIFVSELPELLTRLLTVVSLALEALLVEDDLVAVAELVPADLEVVAVAADLEVVAVPADLDAAVADVLLVPVLSAVDMLLALASVLVARPVVTDVLVEAAWRSMMSRALVILPAG